MASNLGIRLQVFLARVLGSGGVELPPATSPHYRGEEGRLVRRWRFAAGV